MTVKPQKTGEKKASAYTPQNILTRFIFGSVFLAFGLLFLYLCTFSILHCKRNDSGEVTCRLERRFLGSLPIWRQTAAHVRSAHEYIYKAGGIRINALGNTSYIVLMTDRGEVHLKYRKESFSPSDVNEINNFLKNNEQRSWQESRTYDNEGMIGEIAGAVFAGLGLLCYLGLAIDGVLLVVRRGKNK